MMTSTTCNDASLATYVPSNANPWNAQKVNHLYRRAGFGATRAMINDALSKTPAQVVDSIVNQARNMNPTPAPEWGYWVRDDFEDAPEQPFYYRREGKKQMVEDLFQNNLRDRLTLFWSNHFVTEDQTYGSPAYQFQYYNLLQLHGIGNFKEFTRDIGISNAMLIYLNGYENTKNKPNENYARELYELFTLGVNNGYTQQDIVETARALTGYNQRGRSWNPITFDPSKFDNGDKTIFGETGNMGYDDVINNLFAKRRNQIAKFICTKLYRYFVSPVINETVVNQLANTFKNNDFEIAPVLRRLFKSQHFFDQTSYGVIIKSPSDVQICLFKELQIEPSADFNLIDKIRSGCSEFGQDLLRPADVAGWPGDTDWIGSSTLTGRWDRIGWYIWKSWKNNEEQFRTFAKDLMGGNSNDVELISKSILDNFLSKELVNNTEYTEALKIFKNQVPENYFEDGTWDLNWPSVPKQVYKLLIHLIRTPEFQLK